MIALSNKTLTMLYFLRIIIFNIIMYMNLIEEPHILNLGKYI